MTKGAESREQGPGATTESFAYKYRRLTTDPAVALRGDAFGSELPNGYTTVSQAARLADLLGVGPGSALLDLGSGRGWPGGHIASVTGCAPVVADLPLDALRTAGRVLSELDPIRGHVVCADGFRLPFRDRSFDAACHTDVLC